MSRYSRAAIVAVTLGGIGAGLLLLPRDPVAGAEPHQQQESREEVGEPLRALVAQLPQPAPQQDLAASLTAREIRETVMLQDPSEADQRRYYEEHRALFGRRSFGESAPAIRQVLAIEAVQDELGWAAPGSTP